MRIDDPVVPAEWGTETLVDAHFQDTHDQVRTAPLTWSQQVTWRANARYGSNHRFLNLRRVVPVSPRVHADVPSVCRAIGVWLSRHSALRTRVQTVDGEHHQEDAPAGRAALLVVEGGGDGAAQAHAVAERMAEVAFDHAREWPQRIALVVVDDRVRQIALVFSHSTVDAFAIEVVLRDLRVILLRGGISTPPGPQSVDVARRQHGPDRLRSAQAVRHWLREYDRLRIEPWEPGPGLDPRLRRGVLVSAALVDAARLVAARYRVSVSSVLLAGTTAVAAASSGRQICGVSLMASNRTRGDYADAVANLGQVGFCAVDLADRPGFADLLYRVFRASLAGYRCAYYEPAAMRHAFTEQGYDYSTAFLPCYYFNDVRLPGVDVSASVDVGERALRAATEGSTFSWIEGLRVAAWHLLTHVTDEPGAMAVTLTVDTRFISTDAVEPYLRNLERLLVTAAFRDVPWPWSSSSGWG